MRADWRQGYDGKGLELRARKTWPLYPESTQAALLETGINPPEWFPETIEQWEAGVWHDSNSSAIKDGVFLIGNHADEMTVRRVNFCGPLLTFLAMAATAVTTAINPGSSFILAMLPSHPLFALHTINLRLATWCTRLLPGARRRREQVQSVHHVACLVWMESRLVIREGALKGTQYAWMGNHRYVGTSTDNCVADRSKRAIEFRKTVIICESVGCGP